jgi:hypothetical protein
VNKGFESIRNKLDAAGANLAGQIFTHFVTFLVFLMVATVSFTWFLGTANFQPLTFFTGLEGNPSGTGLVFPDGVVPDINELVVLGLETPGRKITDDPDAVGAFFSVMDAGEEMPELKRFLSPFVHGIENWDGTPGDLTVRAGTLPTIYLDREGTRLKGYFQIGRGASADKIRKFGHRARATLSPRGTALVVIPPLVPLLYRDRIYSIGGMFLAAGILASFAVLLWFTRSLKFSLPVSFVVPMAVLWSLGLINRFGPPLTVDMLSVIPLFFLQSLFLSIWFWNDYYRSSILPCDASGPKERFRRQLATPIRGIIPLFFIGFFLVLMVVLLERVDTSVTLFLLAGLFFTVFIGLLVHPMVILKSGIVTAGPAIGIFKPVWPSISVMLLVSGLLLRFGPVLLHALVPPMAETVDLLNWLGVSDTGYRTGSYNLLMAGGITLLLSVVFLMIPFKKGGDLS